MPNKQELVEMRLKAMEEEIDEVNEDIEKVEELLKKGTIELYTDVITPKIEDFGKENLFSDLLIKLDSHTNISQKEVKEKFFKMLEPLNLKKINEKNFIEYLKNELSPILYFPIEGDSYIFCRAFNLYEICRKEGYEIKVNYEKGETVISTELPKLLKNKSGKALILHT